MVDCQIRFAAEDINLYSGKDAEEQKSKPTINVNIK